MSLPHHRPAGHAPRRRIASACAASVLLLAVNSLPAAPAPVALKMSQEQLAQLDIETVRPATVNERPGGDAPARVQVPPQAERVVTAGGEGLVSRVLAVEGQQVQKGQVVAQIESPALLNLQRDYLNALSSFRLAQAAYQRDRELFADGIIAHRRLQETQQAYQERRTALNAARQLLLAAGLSADDVNALERTHKLRRAVPVRAPISGVVLRQLAVAGSRVSAMEPLFRIADVSTLWLTMQMPAEKVADIKVGDAVTVATCPNRGEVSTVGVAVDPQAQTVLVRAVLTHPCANLRLGQLVKTRVFVKTQQPLYRVPLQSVVRSRGQSYVFVKTGSGFAVQPVTVAAEAGDYAWISSGLSADTRVAASKIATLKAHWLGMGGE